MYTSREYLHPLLRDTHRPSCRLLLLSFTLPGPLCSHRFVLPLPLPPSAATVPVTIGFVYLTPSKLVSEAPCTFGRFSNSSLSYTWRLSDTVSFFRLSSSDNSTVTLLSSQNLFRPSSLPTYSHQMSFPFSFDSFIHDKYWLFLLLTESLVEWTKWFILYMKNKVLHRDRFTSLRLHHYRSFKFFRRLRRRPLNGIPMVISTYVIISGVIHLVAFEPLSELQVGVPYLSLVWYTGSYSSVLPLLPS